jgi:methyl-accepting chemotaxis protein
MQEQATSLAQLVSVFQLNANEEGALRRLTAPAQQRRQLSMTR